MNMKKLKIYLKSNLNALNPSLDLFLIPDISTLKFECYVTEHYKLLSVVVIMQAIAVNHKKN